MPAPVIAAGVTALGGIGSGLIQNSGNKSARQSQERANAAALQWERERYGKEDEYRKLALDDYNRRWSAWDAGRRAIFKQYGIDLPGGAGGAPMPGGAPAPGGGGVPAMGGGPPLTLGFLAGRPDALGGLTGEEDAAGELPDDGTDWNDWRKYGLR